MTAKIPGPSGIFSLKYAKEMQSDILKLSEKLINQYGNLVRIPVPGNKVYICADPDLIKFILADAHDSFIKGPRNKHFFPLLGDGLVLSAGQQWRNRRRILNPFFTNASIKQFEGQLIQSIEEIILGWKNEDRKQIDLHEEMQRVTIRMLIRSLFSGDCIKYSEQLFQSFRILSDFCIKQFFSAFPLPLSLALIVNPQVKKARRQLFKILDEIIKYRKSQPINEKNDLLATFLSAKDELTGDNLSENQIRDELMTIFFAGYDTTSFSLTAAMYLILKDADCLANLSKEARENITGSVATEEEAGKLPRIEAAFKEAMRLYPPAYMINRTPIKDIVFKNYTLPAGSLILLSIWGVHRNEACWKNPLEFKPDRFLEEVDAKQHHFAYLPFSGGSRICLGKNLAMMEGILVLGTVLKNYELSMNPNQKLGIHQGATLTVKGGLPIQIKSL
ncbi:cytochrome P450 [Leptospira sp. GIMC2001]|uniref:cytochrome P450 n=1 Tax=Leptospira sp. GIMC2001 TaxID=1513297 RepID=UPI0023495E8C|nr:cytochrome P450 [Leptospira sp. GIMC2001]WCL50627.1 cytochrome P450 [Leptospira sp. GIMC2001]